MILFRSPTNRLLNDVLKIFMVVSVINIFLCYSFFDVGTVPSLIMSVILCFLMCCCLLFVADRVSRTIKVAWALLLLFLLLSYFTHFSGTEYILNTLIFLGILTVLPYAQLESKFVKICFYIFVLYCVLVMAFAPKFESDATTALIQLNTNGSGFVLVLLEFCLLSAMTNAKSYKKPLFVIATLLVIFFQFLFAGRSSLIGTSLLIIYTIFRKRFNNIKSGAIKFFVFFICIFAVIFAYLYAVVLFDMIGHGNVYILGKDIFTGRQIIWSDAFEQLQGHWIFGIGNTLASVAVNNDTSGVTNLHNQMMGYLTCFGIIVFLLYAILISLLISKLFRCNEKKFAVAFAIILLVMSYFDTILYSSANMAYIPIVITILYLYDKRHSHGREIGL